MTRAAVRRANPQLIPVVFKLPSPAVRPELGVWEAPWPMSAIQGASHPGMKHPALSTPRTCPSSSNEASENQTALASQDLSVSPECSRVEWASLPWRGSKQPARPLARGSQEAAPAASSELSPSFLNYVKKKKNIRNLKKKERKQTKNIHESQFPDSPRKLRRLNILQWQKKSNSNSTEKQKRQ